MTAKAKTCIVNKEINSLLHRNQTTVYDIGLVQQNNLISNRYLHSISWAAIY